MASNIFQVECCLHKHCNLHLLQEIQHILNLFLLEIKLDPNTTEEEKNPIYNNTAIKRSKNQDSGVILMHD